MGQANNRTAWRARTLTGLLLLIFSAAHPGAAVCVGDCDSDGRVIITELVTMVGIALGNQPLSHCLAGDPNNDGEVTVDEIVEAVEAAVDGCPASRCSAAPFCGNAVRDPGEDCDDGGICIGGANAGMACTCDDQCVGNGVCDGGLKAGSACATDDQCPAARCVRCKTFGGDGCAANCTLETDVPCNLVPGVVEGLEVAPGTSGAVVHGESLTLPLPFSGTETLTVGRPGADGTIPVVIKAANFDIPKIQAGNLVCACIRSVALQTCGGTLFEVDGSPSPSCTEAFPGSVSCPQDKPCAFAYGPGNSAEGVVACAASGLADADLQVTQDAGGCGNPPICTQRTPGAVMFVGSGSGQPGSGRLLGTVALSTPPGLCAADSCTDAEPVARRGVPDTLPFTTATASAVLRNINFNDGVDLLDPSTGLPFSVQGSPLSCSQLMQDPPRLDNTVLVSAFPELALPSPGDIIVTSRFVCSDLGSNSTRPKNETTDAP